MAASLGASQVPHHRSIGSCAHPNVVHVSCRFVRTTRRLPLLQMRVDKRYRFRRCIVGCSMMQSSHQLVRSGKGGAAVLA